MFKKNITLVIFAMLASLVITSVYAKKGFAKKPKYKNPHYKQKQSTKVGKFNYKDKKTIQDYFANGRYKPKPLPPGIAKNLAVGKPLPPGIAKRNLPAGLRSLLPTYPDYEYLVTGNDILLVNKTTNIISDIITNIIK